MPCGRGWPSGRNRRPGRPGASRAQFVGPARGQRPISGPPARAYSGRSASSPSRPPRSGPSHLNGSGEQPVCAERRRRPARSRRRTSSVAEPLRRRGAAGEEGGHDVPVVRLDQDAAPWPHRRPQRLQDGEVVLLAAVAERSEDVQRAVEAALGERLAQVMPQVPEARGRDAAAPALGFVEERLRLVHAQHHRAPLGQWARDTPLSAGRVEDARPLAQAEQSASKKPRHHSSMGRPWQLSAVAPVPSSAARMAARRRGPGLPHRATMPAFSGRTAGRARMAHRFRVAITRSSGADKAGPKKGLFYALRRPATRPGRSSPPGS
jgi:hypothetical protein